MRCGCRRREDFEGCEPRRGERHREGPVLRTVFGRPRATGPGERETRRTLVWLRGATNPRPPRGGNRRGGEEPRGRNENRRVAPVGPMGAPAPGSGRATGLSARGHNRRIPREEGRREPFPPQSSALEGSEVHEGFRGTGFGRRRGASPGNTSETRPATAEGHGGGRKDPRPATASRAWANGFTTLSWRP